MIYKKFDYSALTGASAVILRPFVTSMSDPWYKICKFNTGCDVEATRVYSVTSGGCIYVGQSGSSYSVIIKYDNKTFVRYNNLTQPAAIQYNAIRRGDFIGYCNKYVRIEYLVPVERPTTPWNVRLMGLTYEMRDPEWLIYTDVVESMLPKFEYNVIPETSVPGVAEPEDGFGVSVDGLGEDILDQFK